ncbi:MAG: hypothetical protein PHH28_02035 [Desulfuromonadaceae bacterium]|nr:hypothetical protein [Desulfuromonadaceae bacterium]
MRGWVASLAERFHWPMQGGLTELDKQISKLRLLRDSYNDALPHEPLHERRADVQKDRNFLLQQ